MSLLTATALVDWMLTLGEPIPPDDLMQLRTDVTAGRVTLTDRERRILATAGAIIQTMGDATVERIIAERGGAIVDEFIRVAGGKKRPS